MANKVLTRAQDGTPPQICFRNSGDFAPATATDLRVGSPTLVQLNLTSVANAGFRQSTKVDLGDPRATRYAIRAALEFAATPTSQVTCELWWAPSGSATAANGNPGNVSGADGAYTGYSANADAAVPQLKRIGTFPTTAQATGTVQVAECGEFVPTERYGSLIFVNRSGAAMHNDAVEMHIVFDPIVTEVQ